jgi:poly(A) polymerase
MARVTLPPNAAPACDVVARLRGAGFAALLAGGCVRDALRGDPAKDFDVATDASTDAVQALFSRTVPVGAQFGVVLVLSAGTPVEVATFRADAEYLDGRRPVSVRAATPQEDAQRRDFTINGMFLDPASGEVLDYVGGEADLAAGIIRAIGDPAARFAEDHLRLLRGVRFAARFDFSIDPATFDAMRAHAASIGRIAWERIGDEVVRILTEGRARRGFELLDAAGLLVHVLPEIDAMHGVRQSPDHHPEGDVFEHTLRLLGQLDAPSETLALGALLHDVAKRDCAGRHADGRITFYGHPEVGADKAVAICQRLKRSRQTWERVDYLVRNHLRHVAAPQMRRSTLRRFLSDDGIDELLELTRIDALAASGDLSAYDFCMRARASFVDEPIAPPPLLRGRDLLLLGYPRGPLYARILDAVHERQLEGELTSREAALAWVQAAYPLAPTDG